MVYMRKFISVLIVFALVEIMFSKTTYAASLSQFSDTISTSRPSASTPLAADQSASATSATVVSDTQNYSIFIASDSASIYADAGETQDNGLNVASMSALNVPSAGQRIIYFTNTITNPHHIGDVVVSPVTAMHTVRFTPQTSIPSGGKIIITFPGSGVNTASPSAQTFSFNGMASGGPTNPDISYQLTAGVTCTSIVVSAPSITCTTTGGSIPGGTVVTFLIGCADASSLETTCTTQKPRLINPTKSTSNAASGATVTTTTADNWKINVQTQDSSSVGLDTSTTTIGIIESVQVQASVDPTLTFTITGLGTGVNINSGHGTSCPSQVTNSGLNSSATFVNLGILTAAQINISAQDLSVATNEAGGYTLTATSSGSLRNVSSNYAFLSSPSFGSITAGTENFGIHACGSDANSSFTPASAVGSGGQIAWPTAITPITVASHAGVTNAIITTVEYAATVSGTTPAGTYNTVITYVATPTFN